MSSPPRKRLKLKQASIEDCFKKQKTIIAKENNLGIYSEEDKEVEMSLNSDNSHEEMRKKVADAAERRKQANSPDCTPPANDISQHGLKISDTCSTSDVKDKEEAGACAAVPGTSMTDNSPTLQYPNSPDLFTESEKTDDSQSQNMFIDEPTIDLDVKENSPSKGVPKTSLNTTPSCSLPLPEMSPSSSHTILFRPHIHPWESPRPFPDKYRDRWDANHVRMPCSDENLYPVDGKDGGKELKKRWHLIEKALSSGIQNSQDLENAILTYNTRYSTKWDFTGLHVFFLTVFNEEETEAFFTDVLQKMVHLALQLPNICTQPIPLLKRQHGHSITLSQKQGACLLANAFFCTFPRRNARQKQSEYSTFPDINFNRLFEGNRSGVHKRKAEKLKCILHYFKRVTSKMPMGTLTFTRQKLSEFPQWEKSTSKLTQLHVSSSGTIEDDGTGMLQVDFANKFLGGGVLGMGCVQEEIRFLINPELMISRLFTEMLDNNESLIMTGCERFSNYTGYSDSFQWNGNHDDPTPRDAWGRLQTEIVAIDALVFRNYSDQFKVANVRRELNKAYCGFLTPCISSQHLSAVATGNWGCGAFGGDLMLKALIQAMAAAEVKRDLCYFTFDNRNMRDNFIKIHRFIKEKELSVSDLWALIQQYYNSICRKSRFRSNLFLFINKTYQDFGSDTDDESNEVDADWEDDKGLKVDKHGEIDWGAYTP